MQHVTFHYRWFDGRGRPRRERVAFDVTFLFPCELRLLLARHNFAIEQFYGDYDGSPLGNDSPRMIVAAGLK